MLMHGHVSLCTHISLASSTVEVVLITTFGFLPEPPKVLLYSFVIKGR
jgi:hypothetical protein